MDTQNKNTTKALLDFIKDSPTAFQATANIAKILEDNGFREIVEGTSYAVEAGGSYYITRNTSALIAFKIPKEFAPSYSLIASHADSPTFKIKEHPERKGSAYTVLSTEAYGGTIVSTWLDRPLSIAGRAVVAEEKDGKRIIKSRPFSFDRDLVLIPNAAIHLQRKINEGYAYQMTSDMLPLFSQNKEGQDITLHKMIADLLSVSEDDLLSFDAYLYNRTAGVLFGADEEFFAAPRIDNLQCAYGSLQGFLEAKEHQNITVFAIFDNEETGSATRMGAASAFLYETLSEVARQLGIDGRAAMNSSFLVSADNAHALHPNRSDLADTANAPVLNGGPVIKHQASQRYATEALAYATLADIFNKAGIPVQTYANRSDLPGGSTLGCIAATRLGMVTADIGMPQLAMHSAYETAGTADTDLLIQACRAFYEADAFASRDGEISFRR